MIDGPDEHAAEAPETGEPSGWDAAWPTSKRQLAGRYELEEPIASGGAAVVWRAFDAVLSRSVAIKLLHPHLASDTGTVERFRREAVAAARLSHPNAVAIYDTGQEDDLVFLVMEYVDGPSLKQILAEGSPLGPGVVAALGEQVASALGEAHAHGLVHRDVKPANILLTADGVAKVTDFGIAKALSGAESTITKPGTVVGTAAYVAPEQLEDSDVDARADVYALGVVLYEALTGQAAFQGDTPTATAVARLNQEASPPREIRADVPRQLNDVVVRSTRRDRDQRFPDGAAMAASLAPLVRARPSDLTASLIGNAPGGVEAEDGAATLRYPEPRADQGRRLLIGVVLGAVLAAVALLAVQGLSDTGGGGAPSADGETVPIREAGDYDPFGDTPVENSEEVGLAWDEDLATAWTTEVYRDGPQFGGKPGVGVWFDLGSAQEVQAIDLAPSHAGSTVEVYARDELVESADPFSHWGERVIGGTLRDRSTLVMPQGPVAARYWLVWFRELAPTEDGYQAGLSEIRFVAP